MGYSTPQKKGKENHLLKLNQNSNTKLYPCLYYLENKIKSFTHNRNSLNLNDKIDKISSYKMSLPKISKINSPSKNNMLPKIKKISISQNFDSSITTKISDKNKNINHLIYIKLNKEKNNKSPKKEKENNSLKIKESSFINNPYLISLGNNTNLNIINCNNNNSHNNSKININNNLKINYNNQNHKNFIGINETTKSILIKSLSCFRNNNSKKNRNNNIDNEKIINIKYKLNSFDKDNEINKNSNNNIKNKNLFSDSYGNEKNNSHNKEKISIYNSNSNINSKNKLFNNLNEKIINKGFKIIRNKINIRRIINNNNNNNYGNKETSKDNEENYEDNNDYFIKFKKENKNKNLNFSQDIFSPKNYHKNSVKLLSEYKGKKSLDALSIDNKRKKSQVNISINNLEF